MIVSRHCCPRARSGASAPPGRPLWTAGLLLLAACATRALPDRFPEAAAVSPAASLPKPAEVTRALREDPGLEEDAADAGAAPPHAHRHGGHHHAH